MDVVFHAWKRSMRERIRRKKLHPLERPQPLGGGGTWKECVIKCRKESSYFYFYQKETKRSRSWGSRLVWAVLICALRLTIWSQLWVSLSALTEWRSGVLAPVTYCSHQDHLPGEVIIPETPMPSRTSLQLSLTTPWTFSQYFSIDLSFSLPDMPPCKPGLLSNTPMPCPPQSTEQSTQLTVRQKGCSHVDAAVDLNARNSSGFDVFLYLHLHHSFCSRNLLFSAHNQDVICIAIFI